MVAGPQSQKEKEKSRGRGGEDIASQWNPKQKPRRPVLKRPSPPRAAGGREKLEWIDVTLSISAEVGGSTSSREAGKTMKKGWAPAL